MKQFLVLLMLACLTTSCSLTPGANQPGVVGQYHLLMFSTPNCEACKTVLPRTDMLVNTQLSTDKRNHLDVKGYILTSADGFHAPDQPTADAYKAKLNLSFPVFPDPWRWTIYGSYYGTDQLDVPGAVVIDPTGKWTKFDPGFTADRVFAFIDGTIP